MIAERPSAATVAGNMTGQSYAAGVDDQDMPHLIALFTDLYSDREGAVIREYSTNAHDAQIEVGVTRPIEITLPSALSPFFKIKDYGVGLDAEDIQRIYSRYGRSTKRGTNAQNGMLGLGCKAALTYTDQFTVESIKDGMRTVCSISRDGQSVPVFTVVASVPDDGPNGTEVIVPVRRHHHDTFATKAAEFYMDWQPGTVLVNGKQPAQREGLRLSDDLMIVKHSDNYYGRKPSRVVMGNVSYPVSSDEFNSGLPNAYHLIARVPIGAVNFVPSREALDYNSHTRATLETIRPQLATAIEQAVQAEVDAATTARGAIQAMLKWGELLPNGAASVFKFKGKDLPAQIAGIYTLAPFSGRKLSQHNRTHGLPVATSSDALFVVGYDPAAFTASHKRKLLQYVEDKGITPPKFFAMCKDAPDMTWIDQSQIAQWADVRAIKLSASSSAQTWRHGRPTGSYDAYIGGKLQHIQAEEIDQEEPIYYGRALNKYELRQESEIIGNYFPEATVVCLPENRFAKFMRNFPEAESHRVGLQAAYDTWRERLSKGAIQGLTIHDCGKTEYLGNLSPSKVDDPDLRRDIYIFRNTEAITQKADRERNQFRKVMHVLNLGTPDYSDPCAPYKILNELYSYGLRNVGDELYIYLNAVYAARKEA